VKPVRFHPEAEVELAAEAQYYDERSAGLGERFTHEVEAAVGIASAFPQIGAPYKYGTRALGDAGFEAAERAGRALEFESAMQELEQWLARGS